MLIFNLIVLFLTTIELYFCLWFGFQNPLQVYGCKDMCMCVHICTVVLRLSKQYVS